MNKCSDIMDVESASVNHISTSNDEADRKQNGTSTTTPYDILTSPEKSWECIKNESQDEGKEEVADDASKGEIKKEEPDIEYSSEDDTTETGTEYTSKTGTEYVLEADTEYVSEAGVEYTLETGTECALETGTEYALRSKQSIGDDANSNEVEVKKEPDMEYTSQDIFTPETGTQYALEAGTEYALGSRQSISDDDDDANSNEVEVKKEPGMEYALEDIFTPETGTKCSLEAGTTFTFGARQSLSHEHGFELVSVTDLMPKHFFNKDVNNSEKQPKMEGVSRFARRMSFGTNNVIVGGILCNSSENGTSEGKTPSEAVGINICEPKYRTDGIFLDQTRLGKLAQIKKKKGDKPVLCDVCGKRYPCLAKLKEHFQIHANEKSHLCEVCGKGFNQAWSLVIHRRTHTGDRPYPCDVCGKKFGTSKHRKQHRASHSDDRPFQCTSCPKAFKTSTVLLVHRKVHSDEKFKCGFCNKVFSREPSFKVHIRRHTGDLPYRCDLCDQSFATSASLLVHVRLHERKTFQCTVCGECFHRESVLKKHYVFHDKRRKYVCELCGKRYSTAYNLKVHINTHTGEKPYSCDQCQNRFTQKSALTAHIRKVHNDERPHSCSTCGKACKTAAQLKTHVLIHTEEGLYTCDLCKKRYKGHSSFVGHSCQKANL